MIINLVQYNPEWEDKEKNKEKIVSLVDKKVDEGSLVIFPEMTLTGFTMKASKFAEKLNGESFQFFSNLAKDNKVTILAGIIENENGNYFNSVIHLDLSGKLISKYRKIHPFSFSTEDKHYKKGKRTVITEIDDWKVGLSICYDLRFPELYRLYGKRRVELIVNIANWPNARIEHWRTLLKARAIENQCFIAGVNRVGNDPKLHYPGLSSLFDPMGNEVISSADQEQVITTEIDRTKVDEVRKTFPFLNDISLI